MDIENQMLILLTPSATTTATTTATNKSPSDTDSVDDGKFVCGLW